jgi:CheY-like chemotaxis protein
MKVRTILIADPDGHFAARLAADLEAGGRLRVLTASTAGLALQWASEIRLDAALLAHDLPGVALAALVRRIREHAPGLPLIYAAGPESDSPTDFIIQALLTEPYTGADVLAALERIDPQPRSAVLPGEDALPGGPPRGHGLRKSLSELVGAANPPAATNGAPRAISSVLDALSQTLQGDPVLLVHGPTVLGIASADAEAAAALQRSVDSLGESSQEREIIRFADEGAHHRHLLYALRLSDGAILAVGVRQRRPLQALREAVQAAAGQLDPLLHA